MRITPHWNYPDIEKLLNGTCKEAGPNVTYEILRTSTKFDEDHAMTKLDSNTWWWPKFQQAINSMCVIYMKVEILDGDILN